MNKNGFNMLKQFFAVLTIVFLGIACSEQVQDMKSSARLSPDEIAYVQSSEPIVALEETYPPFIFIENDKARGISVEYLKLISEKTGLRFRFKREKNLSDVFVAFKAHQIDVATSLKKIPEREEFMAFTKPYVSIGLVMLTNELPIQFPMIVGYSKGFSVQTHLERLGSQVQLKTFENDDELMKALIQKRIGGAVLDSGSATVLEARNGVRFNRSPVNFQYDMAFGFQKNNPILGSILDKGIAAISEAEHSALQAKYFKHVRQ